VNLADTSEQNSFALREPGGASLLDRLNDAQREAVTHPGGPLLVLAGAGSGKTRVITHRVAHLILERGVRPWHVVAVTFTNKAAGEMRERVEALLGQSVSGAWIGTFHSLCLRILRRDGERVGLASGFNIYDTDDQLAVVKRILKAETGGESPLTPRALLSRISRSKNAMESPDDLERHAFTPERKLVVQVYRAYTDALRKANAADFDDLLLRAIELLREHEDVAEGYASRCEQLLVDEYQDTNRPQYLLIRQLSAKHGNVCVVGDEDQSIYRFRGAELRNILEFEADHAGAHVIRLEQNYRSTSTILAAAGAVVANNVSRKGKTLWTENPRGEKLELFRAPDDRSEAIWIAQRILRMEGVTPYEGIAVLYRTNAQSRLLEEVFRRDRIAYQVVGSVQLCARKEIKDVLAYLKLASNPADDVSLRRAINTPTRGIGATTLKAIDRVAVATGLPLMEAAGHALGQDVLPGRSAKKLEAFLDFIADLGTRADDQPVADLLDHVVESTDYEAYLDKAYAGLGAERMENVRGLISAATEFAEESETPTLEEFLDRTALVADADNVGTGQGVTLMTVHCAKGLEFPVIFLSGLEENLFPHAMSMGSDADIEEERRLCYVAMTRARERLLLSHARFRRFQGTFMPNPPSRFIMEMPSDLIEEISPPPGELSEDRSIWTGNLDLGGSSAARVASRRPARTAPAPVKPAVPSADGMDVGTFVHHPRFGGGRIMGREGSGKQLKLTIQFSDHGSKKILPAYTKLRIEV